MLQAFELQCFCNNAGYDICVHLGDGSDTGSEPVPDSDGDEKASKGEDNANSAEDS